MQAVTVEALTTVAGLAIVTGVVLFALRKALNLTAELMDRFGALLSMLIAIVFAVIASLALGLVAGTDLLQAVLNGIFAGLAASGGFDVINGAHKAATDQ